MLSYVSYESTRSYTSSVFLPRHGIHMNNANSDNISFGNSNALPRLGQASRVTNNDYGSRANNNFINIKSDVNTSSLVSKTSNFFLSPSQSSLGAESIEDQFNTRFVHNSISGQKGFANLTSLTEETLAQFRKSGSFGSNNNSNNLTADMQQQPSSIIDPKTGRFFDEYLRATTPSETGVSRTNTPFASPRM